MFSIRISRHVHGDEQDKDRELVDRTMKMAAVTEGFSNSAEELTATTYS